MSKVKYGLIGYPLAQSFSPEYFKEKFKTLGLDKTHSYRLFPLKGLERIRTQLPKTIAGFNVTIPYKTQIIPYLDQLQGDAKKIQSVNCVKEVNGKWIGYNTDWYGFQKSLSKGIGKKNISHAMVLGKGGSCLAILYALKNLGIKATIISRKRGYRGYKNLTKEIIQKHRLIINTTPLGMYPKVDHCPMIPYEFLTKSHLLFDLIYNPQKSLFLERGEERGGAILNGLEMLHLQAERSWEIWND